MRPFLIGVSELLRGGGRSELLNVGRAALRSVSFSQFGEDLFADRSFALPRTGFYVDVGAAYPVVNSNTYRFYLKGWCGITIEPNPELAAKHRKVRPRDVAVQVGVSEDEGEAAYHQFTPADYNTFDLEAAAVAESKGAKPKQIVTVRTEPLANILARHLKDRTIDLMSVDCEGLDLEVLKSSDWQRFRPCLLMVEDHQEHFSEITDSEITRWLASRQYDLVARLSYTSFYLDRS